MKWYWQILVILCFLLSSLMFYWLNLRLNNARDIFDKQILELNQKLIDTQNLLINSENQVTNDGEQSVVQSDWTTYTDEKWNFQIKYPSKWITTINTGRYGEINQETVGGVSWILNIVPERAADYLVGQYNYPSGVFADITYQVSARKNIYNIETVELFKKLINEGNFNREDPSQVEVLGAACWFRSSINNDNLEEHTKIFGGMQMVESGWQSCIPGGGAQKSIIYATSDMVYSFNLSKTSPGKEMGDGKEWEQLLEKIAENFQVINN